MHTSLLRSTIDEESISDTSASVRISYKKGGTSKINTMRPMIEISYQAESFLSGRYSNFIGGKKLDMVVGEAAIGKMVDPATGLVEIEAGQTLKVIRMNEDYEGAFTLMALDPIPINATTN